MLFQKLSIADCPLYLRLLAGPDTEVLSFVLKENETGEVEVGPAPVAGAQMQPRGCSGWVQVGGVHTAQHRWGPVAAALAAGKSREKVEPG